MYAKLYIFFDLLIGNVRIIVYVSYYLLTFVRVNLLLDTHQRKSFLWQYLNVLYCMYDFIIGMFR